MPWGIQPLQAGPSHPGHPLEPGDVAAPQAGPVPAWQRLDLTCRSRKGTIPLRCSAGRVTCPASPGLTRGFPRGTCCTKPQHCCLAPGKALPCPPEGLGTQPTSCRERKQQQRELHGITAAEHSTGRLLQPKRGHAEVLRLRSSMGAKPRRCLRGQQALSPGWCGAESCGAGQQPRHPGAHTGRVGGERGAWGGMKGWRNRGRSRGDLHPPPHPRRGVPGIKSRLPRKGHGAQPEVSNILPSAAGRGQPVPRATMGGWGLQGEDGCAPARHDLQRRGHTQEGQSHHPAGTGDSWAPRWLQVGWGDKTPQDIEAWRKGHYPPPPQAHTQSIPKHTGFT